MMLGTEGDLSAAGPGRPTVAEIERAVAEFRGFVEEGDDSSMYLEPLREFLMAEGDIVGELEMTEEHLKKLKFNFTESRTKRLFVEAVNNGRISESAEQSADLGACPLLRALLPERACTSAERCCWRADIKIANAKKESKLAQQRKDEATKSIALNFAPAVANRTPTRRSAAGAECQSMHTL
jgi:hypothetical protein